MTIPADVMNSLGLGVGAGLEVSVVDGTLNARPRLVPKLKRYTLDEVLVGVMPRTMRQFAKETAWAREGEPVGREL